MSVKLNTSCNNCDSEFSLQFDKFQVIEHEAISCPFCKEILEMEDKEIEDYDSNDFEFLED